MESQYLALFMFLALLVGIMTGFPVFAILMGVGLLFGFFFWGTMVLDQMVSRAFWVMMSDSLPAVPLFLFMGYILERAKIIDRLFDVLLIVFGAFKGSLLITTIVVNTIFAAAVGIVGAPVTVMGLLALPPMLRRAYDKSLATGAILASGTLGILIPPSIYLIFYGPIANLSIARLFAGAFVPGFLFSGLFLAYVAIRCYFQPHLGPSLPKEERVMPIGRLLWLLLIRLVPVAFLVLAVLGSILFGVAAPTEAAAVGGVGAIVLSIATRSFRWANLKDAVLMTMRTSSMILLLLVGASLFTGVFLALGGGKLIEETLLGLPIGPIGVVAIMLAVICTLGMFLDGFGIMFILVPVLSPVLPAFGIDPIWFAILFNLALQTGFLSPPFAISIFFLKAVSPPEVLLTDIYKGVIPFIALQIIGITLCIFFPKIILILPSLLYR